jgi:hypothetical protein
LRDTAYQLRRHRLADGDETTTYVVRLPLADADVRMRLFRQPRRLDFWCARHGVQEAVVGGFYLRDPFRPLGEVWIDGRPAASEPFPPEYRAVRPAMSATAGRVEIAPRGRFPERPQGDLLQAGPLLVDDGRVVFDRDEDREGFSAGAGQFDSDITDGRHPRAAVGLGDGHLSCSRATVAGAGWTRAWPSESSPRSCASSAAVWP